MKQKFLLLAGLVLAGSFAYAADDFKLGYVDVNKVFTTSKPAIAMQEALKVKFAPQQAKLQKMNDNLVSEVNKIQAITKKVPSVDKLQPADKANYDLLQATYQKDQYEFQKEYASFQQALQRSQDFASASVLGKANTILKDISDKGGYDLVMTSNQLVYAKPKYDLTDQLIEQLNKVNSADLIKQLNNVEKQPLQGVNVKSAAPAK